MEALYDYPWPNLPALFSLPIEVMSTGTLFLLNYIIFNFDNDIIIKIIIITDIVKNLPKDRVEIRAALYHYQTNHNWRNPSKPIHFLSMLELIESMCYFELKYVNLLLSIQKTTIIIQFFVKIAYLLTLFLIRYLTIQSFGNHKDLKKVTLKQ